MIVTGTQIIDRALRGIKVLGIGRSLVDRDASYALPLLQEVVEAWKINRLAIYQVVKQPFTLTANTQAYNIGPGQVAPHFAYDPKPIYLSSASCLPSGQTVEQGVHIWTPAQWLNEPNPTLTDLVPRAVYMEHGPISASYNILRFWPIPTSAPTIYLGIPTGLNAFVDLNTSYTFPEGYGEAFRTVLQVKLATPFGKSALLPELEREANKALGALERVNDDDLPRLAVNPALSQNSYYDVTLDDFLNPR